MLLRFEWPTGSVADLSNVDYFFVFVDGVENPVDVWLVAIKQVMKVRTLWSDGTSGRVCFQAKIADSSPRNQRSAAWDVSASMVL